MAELLTIEDPIGDVTDIELSATIGLTGNIIVDIGVEAYLSMSPMEAKKLAKSLQETVIEYVKELS